MKSTRQVGPSAVIENTAYYGVLWEKSVFNAENATDLTSCSRRIIQRILLGYIVFSFVAPKGGSIWYQEEMIIPPYLRHRSRIFLEE
jgi:hypothetical protein